MSVQLIDKYLSDYISLSDIENTAKLIASYLLKKEAEFNA